MDEIIEIQSERPSAAAVGTVPISISSSPTAPSIFDSYVEEHETYSDFAEENRREGWYD